MRQTSLFSVNGKKINLSHKAKKQNCDYHWPWARRDLEGPSGFNVIFTRPCNIQIGYRLALPSGDVLLLVTVQCRVSVVVLK